MKPLPSLPQWFSRELYPHNFSRAYWRDAIVSRHAAEARLRSSEQMSVAEKLRLFTEKILEPSHTVVDIDSLPALLIDDGGTAVGAKSMPLLRVNLKHDRPSVEAAIAAVLDSLDFPSATTQVRFRQWHQHGVLPYFDLVLWYEINQIRVSMRELGELIFPGCTFDPSAKIQKTTRPYCAEAFSLSTLAQLSSPDSE